MSLSKRATAPPGEWCAETGRSQSCQRVRSGRRPEPSNALAVDLALELFDGLLGARPVGVHVEQLLERLERRLLLADLAQDLAEPVERLEVMGVQGQRAPQVAQRALDVVAA